MLVTEFISENLPAIVALGIVAYLFMISPEEPE